jgi:hypothetical protein
MSRENDKKLVPLFGRENDDRSRLFISVLREAADKIRGSNSYKKNDIIRKVNQTYMRGKNDYITTGNIYLYNIINEFKNKFFDPRVSGADDGICKEWNDYMVDFLARVSQESITKVGTKSAVTQSLHTSILEIIEGANGIAPSGSELEFTQELIKILIKEGTSTDPKTGGPTAIDMNSPSTWKNLTEVKYNSFISILMSLIILNNTEYDMLGRFVIFKNDTSKSASAPSNSVTRMTLELIPFFSDISRRTAAKPKDSGELKFNYNFNKYWLQTQLEAHVATASKPINNTSPFFDDKPATVEEQYFNKDGLLYMKDKNGAHVQVDIKSQAYKDLYKNPIKCIGTGFEEDITKNPNETCTRYLQDCLKGKDISKCKEFLDKPDFWNNAEKEVNAMLPPVAVHTLQAFEFDFYSSFDKDANSTLIKVCTTQKWIEKLDSFTKGPKSKLAQADVDAIAKNGKLIGYLNMLVTKINSNPAILNKNYTGPIISQINNPDAFKGTLLYKYGVKPRISVQSLSPSSLDKLRNAVNQNYSGIQLRLGLPGFPLSSRMPSFNLGLVGGGTESPIEHFQSKISDETKNVGHIIALHYMSLAKRLHDLGKQISKPDEDKLLELIKTLKESESKLNTAILYTEKYAQLIDRYGEKDNTSILSHEHLKEFVDKRNKYFDRVNKKQNDLISIIKSIAEAVNNEYQQSSKPSSMTTVDPATISSLLG